MRIMAFLPEFLFIAIVLEGVLAFAFLYGGLTLQLPIDDEELPTLKIRHQELPKKNPN